LPIRSRSGIQQSWSLASALRQLLFELCGEVVVGTTPLPALELLAEQTHIFPVRSSRKPMAGFRSVVMPWVVGPRRHSRSAGSIRWG